MLSSSFFPLKLSREWILAPPAFPPLSQSAVCFSNSNECQLPRRRNTHRQSHPHTALEVGRRPRSTPYVDSISVYEQRHCSSFRSGRSVIHIFVRCTLHFHADPGLHGHDRCSQHRDNNPLIQTHDRHDEQRGNAFQLGQRRRGRL
jgi:hypothetical protein